MGSTVLAKGDRLNVLEEKIEERIELAMRVGANVDIDAFRTLMDHGRLFGSDVGHRKALAYLETHIVAANRGRTKQASRRPIIIRIKNVINLFWPF